jgi:hypothetical protein
VEDPTGSAVTSADAGTTAASPDASDSGSTPAEAVGVESQPSESTTDQTPTPDDSSSAEDSGEGTDDPDDQPRNDDERKLSRRERQRLREAERVNQAVADALAQKEREAATAREAADRQAKIDAQLKERRDKYGQFVGTPETIQTLDTEIADLNRRIRSELANPTGVDLDSDDPASLVNQVAAKEAQKAKYTENQSYEGLIRDEVWAQVEDGFAFPATFPELAADPKAKAAYLHAQGGIPGAMTVLANTIRAAKDAEWQAKADAQAKTHQSELAAIKADRDGWRVRAGGGELSVEEAGAPATDGHWTRERLRNLTPEEYRKHRVSIERAAAAGAIR